jgi:hypothetical protein
MHSFLDSKTMAKALRTALAERSIDITHSDSLELVARQFGLNDWNTLSAKIEAASGELRLPAGWIVTGTNHELYRLGIDPQMQGTVRIERIPGTEAEPGNKFGTLMQTIDAQEFVGQSVSLSAELMSRGAGKGSLWIRVDPVGGGRHLQFDNMHQRTVDGPLTGDVQWTRRTIAFHVPEGAATINYGIMLLGPGTLWARGLSLDQVDPSEVTAPKRLPKRPTNLGFGEAA